MCKFFEGFFIALQRFFVSCVLLVLSVCAVIQDPFDVVYVAAVNMNAARPLRRTMQAEL